jgi:hypothetical protein
VLNMNASHRIRNRATALVIGAAALGGALVTVSTASSDSGNAAQQVTDRAAALQQVRTEVLGRFAVLHEPSHNTVGEALAKAHAIVQQSFRLTSAEAAQITTVTARDDPHARILVSSTQANGVCLSVHDVASNSGSVGCTDTAYAGDAARPLMAVDSVGGGRSRVTALLVDGISSLSVTDGTGVTADVAVSDNVATTVVPAGPLTLAWTAPDGTRHQFRTDAS